MRTERSVQSVSRREPDMANEVELMEHDVRQAPGTDPSTQVAIYDEELVDSQVVITLIKGQTEPMIEVTKPGRLNGQMIMGAEGTGMMRLDRALLFAQQKVRVRPPENTKSLEERLYMTPMKENARG